MLVLLIILLLGFITIPILGIILGVFISLLPYILIAAVLLGLALLVVLII